MSITYPINVKCHAKIVEWETNFPCDGMVNTLRAKFVVDGNDHPIDVVFHISLFDGYIRTFPKSHPSLNDDSDDDSDDDNYQLYQDFKLQPCGTGVVLSTTSVIPVVNGLCQINTEFICQTHLTEWKDMIKLCKMYNDRSYSWNEIGLNLRESIGLDEAVKEIDAIRARHSVGNVNCWGDAIATAHRKLIMALDTKIKYRKRDIREKENELIRIKPDRIKMERNANMRLWAKLHCEYSVLCRAANIEYVKNIGSVDIQPEKFGKNKDKVMKIKKEISDVELFSTDEDYIGKIKGIINASIDRMKGKVVTLEEEIQVIKDTRQKSIDAMNAELREASRKCFALQDVLSQKRDHYIKTGEVIL